MGLCGTGKLLRESLREANLSLSVIVYSHRGRAIRAMEQNKTSGSGAIKVTFLSRNVTSCGGNMSLRISDESEDIAGGGEEEWRVAK